MFSTKTRGGKAFGAEQKIREVEKILLKNKRIEKKSGNKLKPNELIKNLNIAANNLNIALKKSIEDNYFTKIYDFRRFARVKEHEDRTARYEKEPRRTKKKKIS